MDATMSMKDAIEYQVKTNFQNQPLKNLAKYLVKSKKLSFGINEFPDCEVIVNEEIIVRNQDVFEIRNFTLFAIFLIEIIKEKKEFKYDLDFYNTISFVKSISNYFLSLGYIDNYYYLKKEIWKIVIFESNRILKLDFSLFLKQLAEQQHIEEIFEFIEGYNSVLMELNISTEVIYGNSILLKSIAENRIDLHVNPIRTIYGLKDLAMSNLAIGKDLFYFALKQENLEKEILSLLISGLYSNIGLAFYKQELKNLFREENIKVPLIRGLSNIDIMGQDEIDLIIKIFHQEKINLNSFPEVVNLIFSVFNPRHYPFVEELNLNGIYTCIKEAIGIDEGQLTWGILRETSSFIKEDTRKGEILEAVISQSYFSLEKYSQSIEDVLRYLKSIKILKSILLLIAENNPFVRFNDYSSFNHSRFENTDYDEMLIDLITNNKANIRFLGLSIFNSQTFNIPYRFEKNILDLHPVVQYKLLVALTQDFLEPKYILPAMYCLISSKSEIVREEFQCKLEEYAENYDPQTIEVLEELIDKSSNEQNLVLIRITEHLNNFKTKNIYSKENIRELDPIYTQNKIYYNFNKAKYKKFNSKMDKNVLNRSFLSEIARHIQVGKGGGWKSKNSEEIIKMGHFQYGFTLPRDYFIFPDHFEIEMSMERSENWTDEDFQFIKE